MGIVWHFGVDFVKRAVGGKGGLGGKCQPVSGWWAACMVAAFWRQLKSPKRGKVEKMEYALFWIFNVINSYMSAVRRGGRSPQYIQKIVYRAVGALLYLDLPSFILPPHFLSKFPALGRRGETNKRGAKENHIIFYLLKKSL
jgi:hypothetical protein